MRKADVSQSKIFTYQTRITIDPATAVALDAYAEHFGMVERTLFAESIAKGTQPEKLKNEYLKRFGLTARQFNALRVGLQGKADSVKELRAGLIDEFRARLKKAHATIKKLSKAPKKETAAARTKRLFRLHHKKRRAGALTARLARIEADHNAGTVRIAFGSKRLFRAQFDLKANGYSDHAQWRLAWRQSRSRQFMVLGSKDETSGCQGCVATVTHDGSLSLRLRLPDALAAPQKFIELQGLRFAYGHENILSALDCRRVISRKNAEGKQVKVRDGKALSYRFVRDAKGWRVFVSVSVDPVKTLSTQSNGAIGVDFNADHLAVGELNRHGNIIGYQHIAVNTQDKTAAQRRAILGDAVKLVVQRAVAAGKPIVIETLDFRAKKARLEGSDPRRARMLSALAYRAFDEMLRAAAFRAGVDVITANPAYTSVIGAVNFAAQLGISVHLAAACAIARRGLGLKERPFAGYKNTAADCQNGIAVAPTRNGGHVTFALPERNRAKHVWAQWAAVRSRLSAALAEHRRSGSNKLAPAPLPQAIRALCAFRRTKVRPLGASQQYCSADALIFNDFPY